MPEDQELTNHEESRVEAESRAKSFATSLAVLFMLWAVFSLICELTCV